jgi:hypothetical protein
VCACRAGRMRAGWPSRASPMPAAASRSAILSTARLLGAQARTRSPRATAVAINAATVVVLPCTRRAVDDRCVFGGEGVADGGLLRRVEMGGEGGLCCAECERHRNEPVGVRGGCRGGRPCGSHAHFLHELAPVPFAAGDFAACQAELKCGGFCFRRLVECDFAHFAAQTADHTGPGLRSFGSLFYEENWRAGGKAAVGKRGLFVARGELQQDATAEPDIFGADNEAREGMGGIGL